VAIGPLVCGYLKKFDPKIVILNRGLRLLGSFVSNYNSKIFLKRKESEILKISFSNNLK